jgi:hypothetical protein
MWGRINSANASVRFEVLMAVRSALKMEEAIFKVG